MKIQGQQLRTPVKTRQQFKHIFISVSTPRGFPSRRRAVLVRLQNAPSEGCWVVCSQQVGGVLMGITGVMLAQTWRQTLPSLRPWYGHHPTTWLPPPWTKLPSQPHRRQRPCHWQEGERSKTPMGPPVTAGTGKTHSCKELAMWV